MTRREFIERHKGDGLGYGYHARMAVRRTEHGRERHARRMFHSAINTSPDFKQVVFHWAKRAEYKPPAPFRRVTIADGRYLEGQAQWLEGTAWS